MDSVYPFVDMQIIKNGAFHNSLPLFSLCTCTRNNGIVPCEISCTCMQHIKKKGHSYIYQHFSKNICWRLWMNPLPFFSFYVFFFCVSPCCNRMYILSWLCKKKTFENMQIYCIKASGHTITKIWIMHYLRFMLKLWETNNNNQEIYVKTKSFWRWTVFNSSKIRQNLGEVFMFMKK